MTPTVGATVGGVTPTPTTPPQALTPEAFTPEPKLLLELEAESGERFETVIAPGENMQEATRRLAQLMSSAEVEPEPRHSTTTIPSSTSWIEFADPVVRAVCARRVFDIDTNTPYYYTVIHSFHHHRHVP